MRQRLDCGERNNNNKFMNVRTIVQMQIIHRIAQNIDCTFGLIAHFLPFKSDSEFCSIVSDRYYSRLHRAFFSSYSSPSFGEAECEDLVLSRSIGCWAYAVSENGYTWNPIETNYQFQSIHSLSMSLLQRAPR